MVLTALASCPDCALGQRARELVFDAAFASNLGYAVLPFVVVAVLARVVVGHLAREDVS